MLACYRLFSLLCVQLLACSYFPLVLLGQEFTCPTDGTDYTQDADVAFTGIGLDPGQNATVAVYRGTFVQQSTDVTADGEGDFSGTLEPPGEGWTEGDAELQLRVDGEVLDVVCICFGNVCDDDGGGGPGPTQ